MKNTAPQSKERPQDEESDDSLGCKNLKQEKE